jgi:hypothetical protein
MAASRRTPAAQENHRADSRRRYAAVAAAREAEQIKEKHPADITEAELLAYVLATADTYKVLAFHCYDSRYAAGKGFPDLVLCGSGKTIFVELKSAYGSSSPEQTSWKWRLKSSGQDHQVWTPYDIPHIERRIWGLHYDGEDMQGIAPAFEGGGND